VGQGERLAATTDAQGNFSFAHVKPGRYTMSGSKAGYANTAYGATDLGNSGRVLMVGSDQSITGLEYKLTPLGIIQGKVVNRKGEPALCLSSRWIGLAERGILDLSRRPP
jgi:hypothetical protein